jgi:dTDP-4-amino-4,6-dideoxygalactose transaminase
MKKIKFMDLKSQNSYVRQELISHFMEVLDSGNYVSGKFVASFEDAFAKAHGAKSAIACNSGTTAIEIILKALNIGPGDEVIIPAMTFVATMEAVVATGATPVLVDVDATTWTLSRETVDGSITPKTKAIIFVHLHGSSAGIQDVAALALEREIFLVEDAAQAHLAQAGGVSVGNFGVAAAFSFYPGKNLGALGEGGAIVTNSSSLDEAARLVRNWGAKQKYVHLARGSNFRLDELQAGFLEIKLRELPVWTAKRQVLAKIYDEYFDSKQILRPFTDGIFHAYHIYAIRVPNREIVASFLAERGIDTGIHYPNSLDAMEPWSQFFRLDCQPTTANKLSQEFLSLPLHESLEPVDIQYICSTLDEIIS